MSKLYRGSGVVGLCLALSVLAQAEEGGGRNAEPLVPVPGVPEYGFEHDVPVNFRPDPDSHLTLNHRWYRGTGDTSLRWDWDRGGSVFEIRCVDAFPREADLARADVGTGVPRILCTLVPVFSTWMFSESPQKGMLEITVLGAERPHFQFFISLDFSGWKEIRVPYEVGLPRSADTIRIRAPQRKGAGTLYFDALSPWRDALRWREYSRREILWPTPSSPMVLNLL